MKGILKNGGVLLKNGHSIQSKDLEKVTKALPEEIVRRKTLVIQEMRENFRMLKNNTNGHTIQYPTDPWNGHEEALEIEPCLDDVKEQKMVKFCMENGPVTNIDFLQLSDTRPETQIPDPPEMTTGQDDQPRLTLREFERERRRALREQTITTKPLIHWRLPEDDQICMDPEQRLASLRRLNASSCDDQWSANLHTANGHDKLPSRVDHRSASSFPIASHAENGQISPDRPSEKTILSQNGSTSMDQHKTACSTPVDDSVSSLARFEETSKLLRFWEQRIDEYERRRRFEHRPNQISNRKSHRSLEVLSASLLSTRACLKCDHLTAMIDLNGVHSNNQKFEEHRMANSVVIRESIADAHRTREMWQQMTNIQPVVAQKPLINRPSSTGPIWPPPIINAWENGQISPNQVHWRFTQGPSTQMERQIKESTRNSRSLVRNTVHDFENHIHEVTNPKSRPLLYEIQPQSDHDQQIDQLEQEKLLFMNYVQSHPNVVKSLGIDVPWQEIKQKPPVKVELTVVDQSDGYHYVPYDPYRYHRHSDSNGLCKSPMPEGHRYMKNGHHNSLSSGSQRILRHQSQGITDRKKEYQCHTTPRHWKLSCDQSQPCNRSDDDQEDPYMDESGIVYRSPGESLIAKEIREYRAREEELRRSRSELGLPNLEDLIGQGDLKSTVGLEEGRLRGSFGALQINTDPERPAIEGSSPANKNADRPASAGPTLQDHSPKSPGTRQAQIIGGGGHKVATYPPDFHRNTSEDGSLDGAFNGQINEGDFMPVETRIEREMEDLRRREVELKNQREAMGIRYYPVGLAQFTPLTSFSEYSWGEVTNTSALEDDASVCTNIREYSDKKDKLTQFTNIRPVVGSEDSQNSQTPNVVIRVDSMNCMNEHEKWNLAEDMPDENPPVPTDDNMQISDSTVQNAENHVLDKYQDNPTKSPSIFQAVKMDSHTNGMETAENNSKFTHDNKYIVNCEKILNLDDILVSI